MKLLQKIGLFLAMVLVFSAMIMQLSYAEEPLYTYDELMDALRRLSICFLLGQPVSHRM